MPYQCVTPGYGIVACVVHYEPFPTEMRLSDIDGITMYDDSTADRAAVVGAIVGCWRRVDPVVDGSRNFSAGVLLPPLPGYSQP